MHRAFSAAFHPLDDAMLVVIDADSAAKAQRAADQLADRLRADPATFARVYVPGGGPFFARAALLCAEGILASNRARGLELYQELTATTMPRPVRLAALRVLNQAGPSPEYTNRWPAPTGDAAAKDKSGFLGR